MLPVISGPWLLLPHPVPVPDILKKLEESGGFKDREISISVLFFADDGLLLAISEEEAARMIDELKAIGEQNGLKMNIEKSKILIYHQRNKAESIREVEVTEEIRYLMITVTDKNDCFKKHKEGVIDRARVMVNITYPIIKQKL